MSTFSLFKKRKSIIHSLLERLEVPFTDFYLRELIRSNPNSGNMLGISDILYQYNVENISARIDSNDLQKLDIPFLAQLRGNYNNEFAVITRVGIEQIDYISERGSAIQQVYQDFLNQWTGIVMIAETSEKSKETDYRINRRKQFVDQLRLPFILTFLLSAIILIAYNNTPAISFATTAYILLTLLYVAGCTVSILLLMQTIDKNNPFVNKICALAKTNSHCSDVLDSSAAKFFGIISWSEVGFVFFAGNLLSILFSSHLQNILFWINVAALPYTVWSVYYQGRVLKQWCIFCLTIQILLWLCFFTLFISRYSLSLQQLLNIPFNYFIQAFLYFIIPIIGLWFTLPFIKKATLLYSALQELNKIKTNEDTFEAVLKTQKKVEIDEMVNSIFFGNPEASFIITMVTNPYCGPCASMHRKLEVLLNQYSDFLRINTIYAVGNHQKVNDKKTLEEIEQRNKAIRLLTAIYNKYGNEKSLSIYKEWYEGPKNDIDSFIKKYLVDIESTTVNEIVSNHQIWCQKVKIEGTPTLFVNDYELPLWYNVENLKYFIRQ